MPVALKKRRFEIFDFFFQYEPKDNSISLHGI